MGDDPQLKQYEIYIIYVTGNGTNAVTGYYFTLEVVTIAL